MKLTDQVWLSFHNLMLHKIRSVLTSLGIIFGVGSVIAMLAISEGAKIQAMEQIQAMGVDKIILSTKVPPATSKDVSDTSNSSLLETYGLTEQDRDHISKMDNVESICVARDARKRVMHGMKRLGHKLVGVSLDFLEDTRSVITQGRWLSPGDGVNNVCVIGVNARRSLFPLGQKDVVGSTILIEDMAYKVVGVLENRYGTSLDGIGSPNDNLFISMKSSDAIHGKSAYDTSQRTIKIENVDYDTFIIKIRDISYIEHTSRRISSYMGKTHAETKDWDILVPLDLLHQQEQTQNIFTVVMGSIAGISLLVGGIGIMNIMLANVYERRKEIGTRRALGAQKGDIIRQFLFETIFLTTIGGGLGVCLGVLIAEGVTVFANWPVAFSTWFILLALLISAFTGIIFGTYPAWKAAQQNPIEVLRAE